MREKDVNLPCRIFAILVMLFLLAPLVVIVIASFTPTALITFPPQGFSLKWYANIFGSSTHFMDGLVSSLKIGILATALDILLGVTAALSVCRYSFKGKDALLNYYTSPMYVPSVAFAFVLLQVYSQIGGVSGMLRIFIGHLIIILPYIVRNTVSVLHVFNWTLEDAATSMGATPIQVFFKITIPLARPGIMAGALLAFLYSFDEVALSSLLSTPRFITLPIRIMNYMELTFDPTLAAISTLLILVLTVGNVFSRKVIHRSWSFTEELVVAVFVLITLLAAALACREGELVSLTLVTDRLPKKLKKPSVILITVLSIIFSVILFKYGMDKVITQLQNGKRTFVLNWPEWIFWSFVPIGAGCMILHFIEFCLDFCCKTDSAKNTDNSTKSNMNTIKTDKKEAK